MPASSPTAPTMISVVDQTIRDGPQSLYVERMNTMPHDMVFEIAPHLGRIPFKTVDLGGMIKFDRLVRSGEDPWDHIARIRELAPNSTLRWSTFANSITFALESEELCDFAIQTCIKNGVTEFWLLDTMLNVEFDRRRIRSIKNAGGDVVASVMYTLSPVHTDEYFAGKVASIVQEPGLDGIYVEDTAGAMMPDRAGTLIAALRQVSGGLPIEAHFHDFNGFALPSYMHALKSGAETVHTAIGPLSGGGSLPSLRAFLDVLRLDDAYECAITTEHLDVVEPLAWELTHRNNLPYGRPQFYDPTIYEHQLPGGMQSSLQRQLDQMGLSGMLPRVLEEMARVREELGYPVMATPLSQFVGVQAVFNVLHDERYKVVPDELCHYALGHYGELAGEIAPEVLDRIAATPKYRELLDWEHPQTTMAEVRDRLGSHWSDEELLLRMICTESDLRAMEEAKSAQRLADSSIHSTYRQVRDMMALGTSAAIAVSGACGSVGVHR